VSALTCVLTNDRYRSSTVVFNGAVRSQAHAVVKPRSAVDVSR
jgi:hypothetical protein